MARIVVTGAGGFIGSHLCEALLAEGHEVVGLEGFVCSYARELKQRNLATSRAHPRFSFAEADLRTDPIVPWLEGADAVVNLAAMPGLPRSWTELELYSSCNLVAVQRLVDACLRTGVGKLVHASTSSVYGLVAEGDEQQPTRPVSPYGVTKLAAEHLLLANLATAGLPVTILRYFSIYGPRQRPDMGYHIFTERLLAGLPVRVHGDGRQTRGNTYVQDCVRGTIAAIGGARLGEVYNLGGGTRISVNEAIGWIGHWLGVEPTVEHGPARAGDQLHTWADTSKAHEHFGYEPAVEPAEGLRRQVEWHLTEGPSRAERPGVVPAGEARAAGMAST